MRPDVAPPEYVDPEEREIQKREQYKADVKHIEQELRNAKNSYFSQLMAVWLFQMSFVIIIFNDARYDPEVDLF